MGHKIVKVDEDSIAWMLGIGPGDILLEIDGKEAADILDYRFRVQAEALVLAVEKPDGEIWEISIEKEADEDLGISFDLPLMSNVRTCLNKCLFCFVDQQPPGLRPSLYFKDDDPRLSFLHGNYVTLSNASLKEARRLAGYHLSPLYISVHAAEEGLRAKMMGTRKAAGLSRRLEILSGAGISMNFQVVLCKGINDGKHLDFTIQKLSQLEGAMSLAVVPAGITKHRSGLYPLETFSSHEAAAVISQVEKRQKDFLKTRGSAFVFLADEWYITAKRPLPSYKMNEGFPQLANGVGMLRLFEHEFGLGLRRSKRFQRTGQKIGIITGTAAGGFMEGLARRFTSKFPEADITVIVIENRFFGSTVSVSGLLTGHDIIGQLSGTFFENRPDVLFVPQNAFRADSSEMLDGTTADGLSKALGCEIKIGSAYGRQFALQLVGECD